MSTVPTTIEDQLKAMRLGVDYQFTIKIRALSMRVRPLSMAEQVKVTNDVTEVLLASKPNERNSLNESALLAKEMLKLATKESDKTKLENGISNALLERMTPDEIMYFYEQYRDGVNAVNPAVEDLDDAKISVFVEEAKKNGSLLNELSRPVLVKVALSLLTPPA